MGMSTVSYSKVSIYPSSFQRTKLTVPCLQRMADGVKLAMVKEFDLEQKEAATAETKIWIDGTKGIVKTLYSKLRI